MGLPLIIKGCPMSDTPAPVITCYLSLISPYTYLGQPRLMDLAARSGARVDYKPINIMALFEAVGAILPPNRSAPVKAYRLAELTRWSRRLGMPLTLAPKHWPSPTDLASGLVIAAQEGGHDVGPLVLAILRGVWAEDADITDRATLERLAASVGLDGAALLHHAETINAPALYARNTQDAQEAGCFGAPSYIVNGELFWGQDRLDFVAEAVGARG